MANVKITDLPNYTSILSPTTDVIPIVDVTDNTTKKITVRNFFANSPGSGTVTNFALSLALQGSFTVATSTTTPTLGIAGTIDTTKFLRNDGTWAVPAGGGSVTNFLLSPALQTAFTVATSTTTPTLGINGSPTATQFLRGDGTWAVPAGTGGGSVTNFLLSSALQSAFTVATSTTTPTLGINGSPTATQFLRGDGTWAVPAGTGGGSVTNFLLSPALQTAFTVATSTTTPTLGIAGTVDNTKFLRNDGAWAVPSGSSGGGNSSSDLNLYTNTLTGSDGVGIEFTTSVASVTITSPGTLAQGGTWTLGAPLPVRTNDNGFLTGDNVLIYTANNAFVGQGVYNINETTYTIQNVIYDRAQTYTISTQYTVSVKRAVTLARGIASWLSGAGTPSSSLGIAGQYYLDTTTSNISLKTDAVTWARQNNAETAIQNQSLIGLKKTGLSLTLAGTGTVTNYLTTIAPISANEPVILGTGGPDTNIDLILNPKGTGGIYIGANNTSPLIAATAQTGINRTAGTVGQSLFSAGPARSPYWGDSPASVQTIVAGRGYSWRYYISISSPVLQGNIIFTSFPYITVGGAIAVAPATLVQPAAGWATFADFAAAFQSMINSRDLALSVSVTADTVNNLLTVTTSIPTVLVSTGISITNLTPTLQTGTPYFITSIVVNQIVQQGTLSVQNWTLNQAFANTINQETGNFFGFGNFSRAVVAQPTVLNYYPYATADTGTFTGTAGNNYIIFNSNVTSLFFRGVAFTFANSGTPTVYILSWMEVHNNPLQTYCYLNSNLQTTVASGTNTLYRLQYDTINDPAATYTTTTPVSYNVPLNFTVYESNMRNAYWDYNGKTFVCNFDPTVASTRRFSLTWYVPYSVPSREGHYSYSYVRHTLASTAADITTRNLGLKAGYWDWAWGVFQGNIVVEMGNNDSLQILYGVDKAHIVAGGGNGASGNQYVPYLEPGYPGTGFTKGFLQMHEL